MYSKFCFLYKYFHQGFVAEKLEFPLITEKNIFMI